MDNEHPIETLLKPNEVCDALRVCRKTLTRYENLGLIQPIRLNQRVFRYRTQDVELLIETLQKG